VALIGATDAATLQPLIPHPVSRFCQINGSYTEKVAVQPGGLTNRFVSASNYFFETYTTKPIPTREQSESELAAHRPELTRLAWPSVGWPSWLASQRCQAALSWPGGPG
jgi:hypothetical protein